MSGWGIQGGLAQGLGIRLEYNASVYSCGGCQQGFSSLEGNLQLSDCAQGRCAGSVFVYTPVERSIVSGGGNQTPIAYPGSDGVPANVSACPLDAAMSISMYDFGATPSGNWLNAWVWSATNATVSVHLTFD